MTKPLPYGRTFTQMAQLSAVWTTAASWHRIQRETRTLRLLYEFLNALDLRLRQPIAEWPEVDRLAARAARRRARDGRGPSNNRSVPLIAA